MIHYILWYLYPGKLEPIGIFDSHAKALAYYKNELKTKVIRDYVITQTLIGEGFCPKNKGVTSAKVKEGLKLLSEGLSMSTVAHRMKVTVNTVQNWKFRHIDQQELKHLREEVGRLKGILKSQGIEGID